MSRPSKNPAKPISPAAHGVIDYVFAAGNLVLPRVLKLSPAVTGVFAAFGVVQGTLNALTVQPYAADKVVPFALHGSIERKSLGLYLLAPLLAGAAVEKRARRYWLILGGVLVTVYNLTDWNAKRTGR